MGTQHTRDSPGGTQHAEKITAVTVEEGLKDWYIGADKALPFRAANRYPLDS
jgi:hypothetical protein